MEAISSLFDRFDFAIDPFEPSCMYRMLAMIQDSILVAFKG